MEAFASWVGDGICDSGQWGTNLNCEVCQRCLREKRFPSAYVAVTSSNEHASVVVVVVFFVFFLLPDILV